MTTKLFTKARWLHSIACTFVFLLTLSLGNAWAVNWNKITNLSDLSDGDSVLVVIQDGKTTTAGKAYKVSGTTSANSVDVAITSNSYISDPANNTKWAVTGTTSNGVTTYTFKNGTNYIQTGSATNANVGTSTSSSPWYITKLSDGYFKVQLTNNSGRFLCWKGSCFGKYATDNFVNQMTLATKVNLAQYHGAISFYKKQTATKLGSINGSFF